MKKKQTIIVCALGAMLIIVIAACILIFKPADRGRTDTVQNKNGQTTDTDQHMTGTQEQELEWDVVENQGSQVPRGTVQEGSPTDNEQAHGSTASGGLPSSDPASAKAGEKGDSGSGIPMFTPSGENELPIDFQQ